MTPELLVGCLDSGDGLESGLTSTFFSMNASGLCGLKSVSFAGKLKCTEGPCFVGSFSLDSELVVENVEENSEGKLEAGLLLSFDVDPKQGIGFAGAGVEAVTVDGKFSLVKLVLTFIMP